MHHSVFCGCRSNTSSELKFNWSQSMPEWFLFAACSVMKSSGTPPWHPALEPYSMGPICSPVRNTTHLHAKWISCSRPCRPAWAACYSKWLQVTVVSVWPRIRYIMRLETDREWERWVQLENIQFCLVEDWIHLSRSECVLHRGL